jgi:phosphoglycerate-specific signal transduction histidine kinase
MQVPKKLLKKPIHKNMQNLISEGKALMHWIKETLWLQKEMKNTKLPAAQTNIDNALANYTHATDELLKAFNTLKIDEDLYRALKNGVKETGKMEQTIKLIDKFLNN